MSPLLAFSILLGLFAAQPQEADPMQRLDGDAFIMGNTHGDEDERNARSIALTPFYLSKYELTNREFVAFLNDADVRVRGEEVFLDGRLICDLTCTSCGNWQDRIRYSFRHFRVRRGITNF